MKNLHVHFRTFSCIFSFVCLSCGPDTLVEKNFNGPLSFSEDGLRLLVIQNDRVVKEVNGIYEDSNKNGQMDPNDKGWFAPGSTVKVAIALASLEIMGGRKGFDKQFQAALMHSDNKATNTLIDKSGGLVAIQKLLEKRGFQNLVLGRKMLQSQGTNRRCKEGQNLGNCASARDLIRSMVAVVEGGVFQVADHDRRWILQQLESSKGSCRFVHLSGAQKCGISPHQPVFISNLGYFPEKRAYVFISIPTASITEGSAIIDRKVRQIITALP